jgi:hypothetical protein
MKSQGRFINTLCSRFRAWWQTRVNRYQIGWTDATWVSRILGGDDVRKHTFRRHVVNGVIAVETWTIHVSSVSLKKAWAATCEKFDYWVLNFHELCARRKSSSERLERWWYQWLHAEKSIGSE